ncbi:DUF4402 domain-containing protein [Erythrobacter sp. SCSIO 43205]|uniref:DUF4402 domain-containing protein n=1 Tax=Erythrobacter sp. SCSIO 43205 TaxID=2779361 RepID=UPI001CA996A9|nr:DUF4402 domain-containing protein [Erythrobacter sp. SCSIO 43205]UAB78669.1 DUF4402 domain-containing protein [Erythrobacter sp. SCSIO 43205]
MEKIGTFCLRKSARAARVLSAVIAASAGLFLAPQAALAQSDTNVDARTTLIAPLSLAKLSDMDFGDLIVTTGGTVVLNPDVVTTCIATGGVVHTQECQAATFIGLGASGQRVRVRRPVGNTITLTGPGTDMIVTDLTINGGATLTPVNSNPNWERFLINTLDGSFIFRVGGTLNVNANQAPGLYTGTFDIRIDYQ